MNPPAQRIVPFVFAAAVAMSATDAFACESFVIVPEASRLVLASYDGASQNASFSGTERISGRYAIVWSGGGEDEDLLEIRFLPDAVSMGRLPQDPEQPEVILTITNRDAAVIRLLGRETTARVLEGELAGVEGKATLVIGDVETGIDSGDRWWQAAILSVERATVEREWGAPADDEGDGACLDLVDS
jgi:hypothetical protein